MLIAGSIVLTALMFTLTRWSSSVEDQDVWQSNTIVLMRLQLIFRLFSAESWAPFRVGSFDKAWMKLVLGISVRRSFAFVLRIKY